MASLSRIPGRSVFVGVGCLVLVGCVYEFPPAPEPEPASVGAEIFQVLCKRLAAQSFPEDLTGQRFEQPCATGDGSSLADLAARAEGMRDFSRLKALLERRDQLVPALDSVFESEVFEEDELRVFLQELTPFYEGEEALPEATRALAGLLADLLVADSQRSNDALAALVRVGARTGYRPLRLALGLLRPALAYPKLDEVVEETLAALDSQTGAAGEAWRELLRAGALDLATAEVSASSESSEGTLGVARAFLLQRNEVFSAGRGPLYLAHRDDRGVARAALQDGVVPAPFVDADGDGLADVLDNGRFASRLSQGGEPPAPFRHVAEVLAGNDGAARDSHGRALDPEDGASLLYEYVDVESTLLAGLMRDLGPLLLPSEAPARPSPAALHNLAYGLSPLLGDWGSRSEQFGQHNLTFTGPDPASGPIFDLVWALTRLLSLDEADQLLQVADVLLREHESEVAALVEAILYVDERAEAYPDAQWEKPHEFWDDLLAWTQRLLQRPGMLDAMLRSFVTDAAADSGTVLGNFMRFKDRVTYPNGREEELRSRGIDMTQVVNNLGDSTVRAVQAHRSDVNSPCSNPPGRLLDRDLPSCTPLAPAPAAHHRGIRSCPTTNPRDGASCADMDGLGLCSYAAGACVCDCEGGVCRGNARPTWRCGLPSVEGYADWVDRNQPDVGVGQDGQTNQSLFQRTAALIHDLHGPAKLCNKDGARLRVYIPGGSDDELGFGLLGDLFGLLGPFSECELLDQRDLVQFYSRSILGTAQLELKPRFLDGLLDLLGGIGIRGVNKDDLMERQSQIRGFTVSRPTPQAVSRMLFSPFNPFLNNLLALPVTRDDLRIVDLHRDTIFAWERPDPIVGISLHEALTPFLRAMDENELRDGSGRLLDGYLFGDLISIVHRHWPSRQSDTSVRACVDDVEAPCALKEDVARAAFQSNGVSYEELVAEALVDARLTERIRDVMVALDAIELSPGVDAITVLGNSVKSLIDPARACGDRCDSEPLATRDGRTSTLTNTGKPIDQVSPAYLLLDALNAVDARFEGETADRLEAWRAGRSALVDLLFDVQRQDPATWRFRNPRSPVVLQRVVELVRGRMAVYRARETECLAAGGGSDQCRQFSEWTKGLTGRLERSLTQPVSAAALRMLEQLWGADGDPGGKLLAMVHWMTQEQSSSEAFDATLLALADLLQLLEDEPSLVPLMRYVATAVAPSVHDVVSGRSTSLDVGDGSVERARSLLRQIKEVDPGSPGEPSVLTKLLRRLVEPVGTFGETPLEVILDTIAEVNRVHPRGAEEGRSLSVEDLRAVLDESEQFLSSERHGLERLYDIIQARKLP